jgi:hypothetical protein
MKMIARAALVTGLLSATVSGFVPNHESFVRTKSSLSMSAALIVQNRGGGHGELGYQLAKNLSSNPKITSITILQDGACNYEKEPFKSYKSDLPDVKVVKASLADESMTAADLQKILGEGEKFDYVWDNASKAPEGSGKAICDCAKEWGVKLLTYVSSAGIYKPSDVTVFPMAETTPVKETAGQALYDKYAVDIGLPLVSFRPQVRLSTFRIFSLPFNAFYFTSYPILLCCRSSTSMEPNQISTITLIGTLTDLFADFLSLFLEMERKKCH